MRVDPYLARSIMASKLEAGHLDEASVSDYLAVIAGSRVQIGQPADRYGSTLKLSGVTEL